MKQRLLTLRNCIAAVVIMFSLICALCMFLSPVNAHAVGADEDIRQNKIRLATRVHDGGYEVLESIDSWTYGDSGEKLAFRPEYGKTLVYSFYKSGSEEVLWQFAKFFVSDTAETDVTYHDVSTSEDGKLQISEHEIEEFDFDKIPAGDYQLKLYVPECEINGMHINWWTGSPEIASATFEALTKSFDFSVNKFEFVAGSELVSTADITVDESTVYYNGKTNNTPSVTFKLNNGRVFEEGVDYELKSVAKNVGPADLVVDGIGSLNGSFTINSAYNIVQATNTWERVPNIMRWDYGNYKKERDLITATPALLDNKEDLWFKISTDRLGITAVKGLDKIYLEDGLVSDGVADILNKLDAGSYYLFATVEGNNNYTALSSSEIEFRVFKTANRWDITPGINAWIKGEYNSQSNPVVAQPHFGIANVVITDTTDEQNVIYDAANNINKLADAPVGVYVLTATVEGNENYSELSYTTTFRVFVPETKSVGIPWWGVLLIVLGIVAVIILLLFILHVKGVLQLMTGKMVVAMRAKANVDATIAAVRANKIAQAAKAAEERDIAESKALARKAAVGEEKPKSVEEKAAVLESKARATEEKAEAMRAKAEAMKARAAAMKEKAATKAAHSENSDAKADSSVENEQSVSSNDNKPTEE